MTSEQTRRAFFLRSAQLALGVAAFRALPVRAAAGGVEVRKDPALIVRSPMPLDLETPVHMLDTWITPLDRYYVRCHIYTPKVDLATWRFKLEGAVEHPLTLTLDELKAFSSTSEVVTIECAGNGRGLFEPHVSGAQWVKGSVGTARWTGVRLADVLAKAAAKKTGFHAICDGADRPMGNVPDFVRSIPIEKCWDPATLLAWEMNGQPIPIQHGFPLRLIVPGWEGASCVKWLTSMNIQDHEAEGFFMKTAYRYPTRPLAPGEPIDPSDMRPIMSLAVKSLITSPVAGARVAPGAAVEIQGVAWAGENEITKVDVSMDMGNSWQAAQLGRDRDRYAWRRFQASWKAPEPRGSYAIMSRATDSKGRVQPVVPQWNPSGYLHNMVDVVWIHSGDPGPAPAPAPPAMMGKDLPDGPGREIAERTCTVCHDATLIRQQHLDHGRWVNEVGKMEKWGAALSDEERKALVEYLFLHFR